MKYVKQFKNTLINQTLKKTIGVFFSQGLLSLTNLVIGLCLIRYSSKEEYGLYVTAYATLLLYQGIQNAIITTPLIVFSAGKHSENKAMFIDGLRTIQFLIFTPLITISMLAFFFFYKPPNQINPYAFVIFGFTIFTSLTNEFIKSILYSKLSIKITFRMDLIFAVCTLLAISWLVFTHINVAMFPLFNAFIHINVIIIVSILGISYFVSSVYGYFLLDQKPAFCVKNAKETFKETWPYSRWSVLGVLFTFLQSWGYVYIVSAFSGMGNTAEISAAKLIMMPVNLVILSWGRVFMPKGAILLEEKNIFKIKRLHFLAIILLECILAFYLSIVFLGRNFIFSRILTKDYGDIWIYILLWACVCGISVCRSNTSLFLQILKKFKELATAVSISSIITLGVSIYFLPIYGSAGSIFALLVGELVLGIICWLVLYRYLNKDTLGSCSMINGVTSAK